MSALPVGTRRGEWFSTGPRRIAVRLAGPLLIVAPVLVIMHGFWLLGLVTNQHGDLLAQWLPWYCHLGRSIGDAEIPAWNPYQFAGMPFAADAQKGWLYLPAMLLFSVFGCGRALGIFITLQPMLAGLGIYWFLRLEGVGRPASTVGGVTMAMTMAGSAIALSLPFSGTLAWLALTLAAAAGYVRARTPVSLLGWLTLIALALSQAAAAHLSHGLGMTLFVVGLYLLVRLAVHVRDRERTPSGALALLIAPFLAFPLLTAAVLLPRLGLLRRSPIGMGYLEMARMAGDLTGFVHRPQYGQGISAWWGTAFARGPEGYVGALALLVVPVVLASKRWRSRALPFVVAAFVGWFLNIDRIVETRSVQRAVRDVLVGELWLHSPNRFRYLLVVAFAVVAGYGLQAWIDDGHSDRSTLGRRLGLLAMMPVVFVVLPLMAGAPPSAYGFFFIGAVYSVASLILLHRGMPGVAWGLAVLVSVELGAAGWVQLRAPDPGGSTEQVEHVRGSGLGVAFPGYDPPSIEPAAYVEAGAIGQRLVAARDVGGRYVSFDPVISDSRRGFLAHQEPALWPAYTNGRSMLFGIEEIQGYSPIQLDRYWRFVQRANRARVYYNQAHFRSLKQPVLELLAVRWLILPASSAPPEIVNPRPAAAEGRWRLYELEDPVPRASMVYSVRSVGAGEGLDDVLDPAFDSASEAIVEHEAAPPAEPGGSATVRYEQLSPQRVRITVETDRPGLLVVRNTFDGYWDALIDQTPTTVLPTDYVLQGVFVPTGRHVVDLVYRDVWLRRGFVVSTVAWLLLGAAAVWLSRAPRGGRPTDDELVRSSVERAASRPAPPRR